MAEIFLTSLLVATIYLMPAIIAIARNHPSAVSITTLNLFLGWTIIGWVAALGLALTPIEPK